MTFRRSLSEDLPTIVRRPPLIESLLSRRWFLQNASFKQLWNVSSIWAGKRQTFLIVNRSSGPSFEDLFEGDPPLEPRQRRAETEVQPLAEAQVPALRWMS